MTRIPGKGGALTFSGLTAGVESWTLNMDAEIEDMTGFVEANAGYHWPVVNIGKWSVDVVAMADTTSSILAKGTTAAMTLQVATGKTFTGTAMLGTVSVNVSATTGKVTINYGFVEAGVLTAAWA